MKKSKKYFTEERVDEIFDVMFDLAMGLGPVLMVVIPKSKNSIHSYLVTSSDTVHTRCTRNSAIHIR